MFNLDLNTTKLCNMQCAYCYEHDATESNTRFDNNLATNLIDYVESLLAMPIFESGSPNLQINFWGGEPTLNMDLLESIISRYAYNRFVSYLLYTNGSNFEQVVDLIRKYNLNKTKFRVQISYDGYKLQDKYRLMKSGTDTSTRVLQAIITAIENDLPFSVHSTVPVESFNLMPSTYAEFQELYKEYCTKKSMKSFWYKPIIDTSTRMGNQDLQASTAALKEAMMKIYAMDSISKLTFKKSLFGWFSRDNAVCNAGSSGLIVDTNGDVLTCHGCLYLKDRDKHVVANIKDLDVNNRTLLHINYFKQFLRVKPKQCLMCNALFCMKCNAHCYEASNLTGLVSRWTDYTNSSTCHYYRVASQTFYELDGKDNATSNQCNSCQH